MQYKIRVLSNGRCTVPEKFIIHGGRADVCFPFNLYVYLIEGDEKPILIETTCKDVDEMNRQAGHVMGDLISQLPNEKP
jgi:hypothetical protein